MLATRKSAVSFTLCSAFLVAASHAHADLIQVGWIGPDGGIWHDALHWDPSTIPSNAGADEYHALIDTRFGNLVNLGTNATVSALTIGSEDHLSINNARILEISAADGRSGGGIINNAGVLEIGSTGSSTRLRPENGIVSLTGGGTVLLSDNANNHIDNGGGGSLVNVDNTIRGAGNLSWTTSGTWLEITNQSLIVADGVNALHIRPTSPTFTNQGILRAENGATLQLNAGTYENVGGLIEALEGSTVAVDGNATITGGEIATVADGVVRVTSSTPRFINLTNSGDLIIDNSRILQIEGGLENTGTIEIGSTGSATYLRPVNGEVMLTGGGTIVLSDNSNNYIYNGGGGSLVNVDNTIRGAGNLSWTTSGTWLEITNQSLIVADGVNALHIRPTSPTFTNQGILRAENGATLQLNAGTYENVGGLIEALEGSTVAVDGNATITGGEIATVADGVVRVTSSTPRFINLTNSGDLIVDNSRVLQIEGVIENSGVIKLDSTGSSTYMRPVEGVVTLTGGGTVVLSDNSNNYIYNGDGEGSLVNVDNTIRGAGNLSWTTSGTWMEITNQSLIVADGENTLHIRPTNPPFTNEGILRAENGATLQLNSGIYENIGGLIEAQEGSTVAIDGNATITGGEIATAAGGTVQVTGSTPRLVDLTHSGHLVVNNSRILQLEGAIENTGVIELGSTGSATELRPVNGVVMLTGGGSVVLSDNLNNIIRNGGGDGSLLNVDNTIRGAGSLSGTTTGTWLDITNQGTIIADAAVNPLRIYGNSENGFLNDVDGLIEVTGAGGLASSGGTFTNLGQIIVHEDRTMSRAAHLTQAGGVITVNGELAITGSGNQLQLQGGVLNGNGQITGTLNNTGGSIEPGESLGTLHVQGTLMQSGSGTLVIEIDDELNHDLITVSGSANLGGVLDLQISEDFNPLPNTEIVFLEAGSITGTFDQFLPCDGSKLRIIYDAGEGTVAVRFTESKTGDLDCSSAVGVPDLLLLLAAWGDCNDPETCPADLDENGSVGVPDLLILLANWG